MSITNPLYLDSLETLRIPSSETAKQRRRQGASTTLIGDHKLNMVSPRFIESFKSSVKENTQRRPVHTKPLLGKKVLSKKDLNRTKKSSKKEAELAKLRAAIASTEETSEELRHRIIKFEKYIEKIVQKATKTSEKRIKTRRNSKKSTEHIINRSNSLPTTNKVVQHMAQENEFKLEAEMKNLFNRTTLLIKYLKKNK